MPLEDRALLLVPDGSRVYDIDAETAQAIDVARRDGTLEALLAELGLGAPAYVDDAPLVDPPVRALSLAVAQKCNLGCTYCYAQQGDFGGPAKQMPDDTALAAVDLLLRDAAPGDRFNLSFLGGEPLLNRATIVAATERAPPRWRPRARRWSRSRSPRTGRADAGRRRLLRALRVRGHRQPGWRGRRPRRAAAVSQRARQLRCRARERVAPLLARQRRMQVSARVTVTPRNLELRETLDAFVELGFHSVGFSPLLRSPTGRDELGRDELAVMLDGMVACGDEFERRVAAGERYPFSNLVNALREIHRGTHRPYPCGAGAGYLGVSADGELAACHRFVGDAEGAMGDVVGGVDRARQASWLETRHVHRQTPCAGAGRATCAVVAATTR